MKEPMADRTDHQDHLVQIPFLIRDRVLPVDAVDAEEGCRKADGAEFAAGPRCLQDPLPLFRRERMIQSPPLPSAPQFLSLPRTEIRTGISMNTEPCAIFPVKSGIPIIGLGLILLLILIVTPDAFPLPVAVLLGLFAILLIWLGIFR
jgi:hypothetical protein